MKACNYCSEEKPLSEYLMMRVGYRRHTCTRCYADYLNDTRGFEADRYEKLMASKLGQEQCE